MPYEEEEYDFEEHDRIRRYSPRRTYERVYEPRRRSGLLNPEYILSEETTGIRRSRSTGGRPNPAVIVVNENINDHRDISRSRSPPYPRSRRYSPEERGRGRVGEHELAAEVAELVIDKQRSHSRGRTDQEYRDWELAQREKELREREQREAWERRERAMKDTYEAERIREEAKRKAEERALKNSFETERMREEAERLREEAKRRADERALKNSFETERMREEAERLREEAKRKAEERAMREKFEIDRIRDEAKRKADAEAAAARERHAIEEFEWKQRREAERRKAEEERIIEEHDRRLRKEAEERRAEELRIKEKLEREEREAKEKEKREWEEFERKQRERAEKEKEEKRKEKEKVDEATRKRLLEAGFSLEQVERIMKGEEKEKEKQASQQVVVRSSTTTIDRSYDHLLDRVSTIDSPQYVKVHKKYLDVKTLHYYQIPYQISDDPDFILILRHLDQYEIDILCEHTRRLRAGDRTLLIEENKDKDKKFAWYRKRDRSTSAVRREGILMYKK